MGWGLTRIGPDCSAAGIIGQALSVSNAIVLGLARKFPISLARNSTHHTARALSATGREALRRGSQSHER